MKLYNSIGEILKEFRNYTSQKQFELCQMLSIPDRTYRRWENNENLLKGENIRLLSVKLKIPFEVLLRLNHGYETYYDIRTRQFKRNEIDVNLSNLILSPEAYSLKNENDRLKPISNDLEIDKILEYDHHIYPTSNPISKKIIARSSVLLPELNLIVYDSIGNYIGHLVCIPIKNVIYRKIKEQILEEGDLRIDDLISNTDSADSFTFYVYSFYAASANYALVLFRRIISFLKKINRNNNSTFLAAYAVTEDGIQLCKKLGMKIIFENIKEKQELNIDRIPCLYETDIKNLISLVNKYQ